MTYKEVHNIICGMIFDISQFVVDDDTCEISVEELEKEKISQKETDTIFRKLVSDGRIDMKQWANEEGWSPIGFSDPYSISIYRYKFQIVDSEYFSSLTKTEIDSNKGVSGIEYKIVFTDDRKVLLNGDIELSSPHFNKENGIVFRYLYEHPNKTFTKSELEGILKIKIYKDFDIVVENLGFKKGLKQIFFDTSKDSIMFYNPARKVE